MPNKIAKPGDKVRFSGALRTIKRVTTINGVSWYEFEEAPGELTLASRCKVTA